MPLKNTYNQECYCICSDPHKNNIEEEVYIEKPNGFALTKDKEMVCKLQKKLYGLKQEPTAWYEILHSYLIKINFIRKSEDSNVYLKVQGDKILLVEVFVDDIIFGGNDEMGFIFFEEMKEFELSMIGEIKFFIGLQISQLKGGIYIS